MQRKNIPNYVLAKGISKDGFEQLRQDIRNAVMEEGVNEFSNYSELLNFIKEKDEANSEKWISDFEGQLNESITVINENMAKIEGLFSRIFADWEVYKEEHNIVEETKEEEKVEENPVPEEQSTVEVTEAPEVEIKVELEPVVTEEKVEETNAEVAVEEKTEESPVTLEQPAVEVTETTEVEVEEATKEVKEEKTKKDKKSKKDKSEAEGDNNG